MSLWKGLLDFLAITLKEIQQRLALQNKQDTVALIRSALLPWSVRGLIP